MVSETALAADAFALMLAPLEGDAPAGVDLREDFTPQSIYYRLRDARAEARALERAADSDTSAETAPPPQWRTVRDLATLALTTKTKDLEIAAWLTEALIRADGLPGLAAGADLIADLARAFWDGVCPMPDEDGMVTRVAPVTGLNGEGGDGTLVQPLRKLALFTQPDGTPVAFWQYEQSEQLQGIGDAARVKHRIAAGVRPFADADRDAKAAGGAHFARLKREADTALAAWTRMGEALDTAAGADSPPTGRIRDLLSSLVDIARRYAPPETGLLDEPQADAPGAEPDASQDAGAAMGVAVAAPKSVTRDDMLRDLARIAAYFRRTEPHSPLSYSLEDAVRRGRMSWPELLAEVVPDAAARDVILTNLGIWPAKPET